MMPFAVIPISQAPPTTIRPSLQLAHSKHQDKGEKVTKFTKSTTLFPMRICEESASDQHDDVIPGNGNIENVFCKNNNFSKPLPLENKCLNNDLRIDAQKYIDNVLKKNENVLSQYNCQKFARLFQSKTQTEMSNKEKMNSSQIPKYLKCYTCCRIVKENEFCQHLLFGSVYCKLCNVFFGDCENFYLKNMGNGHKRILCNEHSFCYCVDPAQFLIKNLPVGNTNGDSVDKVRVKALIKIYINKLKSLEQKNPWDQAIAACRRFVTEDELKEVNNEKVNVKSDTSTRSSFSGKSNTENHSLSKTKKCTEDVLLQVYDISQLEKATEFVKVPDLVSPSAEEKPAELEKRVKAKMPDLSDDEEAIEFVPIPLDGFYYVSVKPIEECPNCYEVLCPSRFTVNVVNFLMTVVCDSCNLTIYITSVAPDLQIITEDTVKETTVNKKSKEDTVHENKIPQGRGRKRKKQKHSD
ncbi:uncharacterized protein LOC135210741 [Macrobrachium nipponense]|uniref:uncharacterized protein LOC135210741 n=1 Tax=Macrobrachium nipponense TaxID=159736 RepID=UPI0030C83A63